MAIENFENLVEKHAANLHDKNEYVIHIRNFKRGIKSQIKTVKFNQNTWNKPYIDIKTDLRKKAKHDFEKDFVKLMNNAVFGKTTENARTIEI